MNAPTGHAKHIISEQTNLFISNDSSCFGVDWLILFENTYIFKTEQK
jgi:hypothetical protein